MEEKGMNRIEKTKRVVKILGVVFAVLLVVIILNLVIHVRHVKQFNERVLTVDYTSDTTEVWGDIHQRGLATDSWQKVDYPSSTLTGTVYEGTVYNNSGTNMTSWTLRIDILSDCFINNGWNGTFEIHQFENGYEYTSTLSLQDYSEKTLGDLKYGVYGADLLIPLSKGDYVIYYPTDGEAAIKSASGMVGESSMGMIFYSEDGKENLTHYTLEYTLYKSIWTGSEATLFKVLMPTWFAAALIFVIVSLMVIRFEKRYSLQSSVTTEFLNVFSDFVDAKDPHMKDHSKRVAAYSRMIAHKLGMARKDCENVYYAGLVHDIGKCYVPDYILQKPGSLTTEEFETVKSHTLKGYKMLENCKSIPGIAEGALYHHERYDGTGYPTEKAGEDIPLIGRIISIADSYDVMRNGDVYRTSSTKQACIEELKKGSGTQYDPVVLEAFLEVLDESDREEWTMS